MGIGIIPVGIITARKDQIVFDVCTHGRIPKQPVHEFLELAKCDQRKGKVGGA